MTNYKKGNIAVLVILVIAVLAFGAFYFAKAPVVEERPLGATPGLDFLGSPRFYAGIAGNILATTTASTATTLRESDLVNNTVIEVTPTVGALTYTLPATSTLSTLFRGAGTSHKWVLQNATTTAGATLTVAAGTGWELTGIDANVDVIAGAAAGSQVYMVLDCYRKSNKDVACTITENIAAD